MKPQFFPRIKEKPFIVIKVSQILFALNPWDTEDLGHSHQHLYRKNLLPSSPCVYPHTQKHIHKSHPVSQQYQNSLKEVKRKL